MGGAGIGQRARRCCSLLKSPRACDSGYERVLAVPSVNAAALNHIDDASHRRVDFSKADVQGCEPEPQKIWWTKIGYHRLFIE